MPVKETVTIEVEATGDGLRKIATDAKHANKALKKTSDVSKKTGSTFAENAELAERMRAALGPLGDVLGDVTGGADDVATALGKAGAKKVAVVAMGVAVVAAFVKITSAAVDVIANLDEYGDTIDRLNRQGTLNDAQVEGLEQAKASYDSLMESAEELMVVLASSLAPVIGAVAEGFNIMAMGTTAVFSVVGKLTNAIAGNADSLHDMHGALVQVNTELFAKAILDGRAAEEAAKAKQKQDELNKSIREIHEMFKQEEKDKLAAAKAARERAAADQQLAAMLKQIQLDEANAVEKVAIKYADKIEKVRELGEASNAADFEIRAIIDHLRDLEKIEAFKAQKKQANDAKQAITSFAEASIKATQHIVAGVSDAVGGTFDEVGDGLQETADKSKMTAKEVLEEINHYAQMFQGQVNALLGAVNELFNQSMQEQIDAAEKGSAREKQLMREQFKKNKEFAIAQAGINMALGIVNALATSGNIFVGIAMAALVAATGAVQIGLIASKKNPYHRGGIEQLAPDERVGDSGRSVTRNNEVSLHVTRQGQRTLADHLNDMNRGPRGAGNRGPMVLVVDGRPIRNAVYQMGEADPRYGVASRRSS